ncbi:glycine-rich cell wall structural protein 1-like [Spinacia oleracea]|uniref:Glycine-rich cell wall structural protein 1-like n=1 Tax=Spinacia oleracea TaxID=3562 RepID=A0ABM3QY92_SPIOL|nr:glycine-rich cell wall structural protein 1-like [Spinacia oleracea]
MWTVRVGLIQRSGDGVVWQLLDRCGMGKREAGKAQGSRGERGGRRREVVIGRCGSAEPRRRGDGGGVVPQRRNSKEGEKVVAQTGEFLCGDVGVSGGGCGGFPARVKLGVNSGDGAVAGSVGCVVGWCGRGRQGSLSGREKQGRCGVVVARGGRTVVGRVTAGGGGGGGGGGGSKSKQRW